MDGKSMKLEDLLVWLLKQRINTQKTELEEIEKSSIGHEYL